MLKIYNKDEPIKSIADDLLGYKTFAQQIAGSIREINEDAKWVISLQGPWGCGKTSIINMVKKELVISSVKIIDFQPWNFKNTDQLIQQFFIVLRDAIPKGKNDKIAEKIYKAIKRYSDILICVPKVGGNLAFIIKKIAEIKGAEYDSERDNLLAQKEKIAELLRDLDQKFLIVIDDIDRLQKSEIPLIFQLVKSIADFPNINYLLSFDKTIVVEALNNTQGVDGAEYLKKIIQIPFDVPPVNETKVVNTLNRQLTEIANHYQVDLSEHCFNNNILGETFGSLIKNLRDVNLLCNRVKFIYPPIRNFVNFEDMMKLQAINLFAPQIYSWIKHNQEAARRLGRKWSRGYGPDGKEDDEETTTKEENILTSVYPQNSELMKRLLISLFRVELGIPTPEEIKREDALLHQNKRIASRERIAAYFSLDLDSTMACEKEFYEILKLEDENELRNRIDKLCSDGKLTSFLSIIEISYPELEEKLNIILSQSEKLCQAADSQKYAKDLRDTYTSIAFFRRIKNENTRIAVLSKMISTASIDLLIPLSFMFNPKKPKDDETRLWIGAKEPFSKRLGELQYDNEFIERIFNLSCGEEDDVFSIFHFLWKEANKDSFISYTGFLMKNENVYNPPIKTQTWTKKMTWIAMLVKEDEYVYSKDYEVFREDPYSFNKLKRLSATGEAEAVLANFKEEHNNCRELNQKNERNPI